MLSSHLHWLPFSFTLFQLPYPFLNWSTFPFFFWICFIDFYSILSLSYFTLTLVLLYLLTFSLFLFLFLTLAFSLYPTIFNFHIPLLGFTSHFALWKYKKNPSQTQQQKLLAAVQQFIDFIVHSLCLLKDTQRIIQKQNIVWHFETTAWLEDISKRVEYYILKWGHPAL